MESKLTISVAIATYNRAAMVRQAIESALAQSRPPDEIVVSDDASTDGTRQVLAALAAADSRLRVLARERNSGGVPNWNAAIAATRGDLIAWCSDDDRFLEDHLRASAEYLESNPEIGLVHSAFVDAIETPDGTVMRPRQLRSPRPLILNRRSVLRYLNRYYDWPFHPSTIVMRRRVWEQVGEFDPDYALADTDWFVRAAEQFELALLPRHGVLNRRHLGNWSNRVGSANMQREISAIVERAIVRQTCRFSPRRLAWRAIWRSNVRLHLLLTMRKRLAAGHTAAACAAWRAFAGSFGPALRQSIEKPGEHAIRALIRRYGSGDAEPEQAVTPL
jgi:glycosyltransferase involved in cell wall biosynthesis